MPAWHRIRHSHSFRAWINASVNLILQQNFFVCALYLYSYYLKITANLAKGKTTSQKTSYSNYPARFAVNGNFADFSHTLEYKDQWWMVDLGRSYNVNFVRLYNRGALSKCVIYSTYTINGTTLKCNRLIIFNSLT